MLSEFCNFLCCLFLFVVTNVVGATFIREDVLDDFGDPTGKYQVVTEKQLSGTYKNASTSNGKCNYSVVLTSGSSAVTFIIYENGKDKNLSTAFLTNETYDVKVKVDTGEIVSYTGRLKNGLNYNYNAITIDPEDNYFFLINPSLRNVMLSYNSIKVSIKNDSGSYSLGTIDTSEVSGLFYDKTLYAEAEKLFFEGDFEDAKSKILEMEKNDTNAFNYYNGVQLKANIYKALYYGDAVSLYNEGKYEEAKERLQILENEMPVILDESDVDELKECIYSALGEYYLGMKGPAGGYIFYDCDADNDSGNEDGLVSSECGWRYLEAAPEDIGRRFFGNDAAEEVGGTSTEIGRGKNNTKVLVSTIGESSYDRYRYRKWDDYAAKQCADYSYGGVSDWFLPSIKELNMMFKNLHEKGLGSFISDGYWSSSEYGGHNAWTQDFNSGSQSYNFRSNYYYVRPVRSF